MKDKNFSSDTEEFSKFSDLEQYDERDGSKCVGVFRYRLYEDKNGVYAMRDSVWKSDVRNEALREIQMLKAVSDEVTSQMYDAVDPEMNDFDE